MQSKNGFIFLEGDSPGESLSNSLEVPETVLNSDGQLQRLSATQTSCPVFVPGKCMWRWWQQPWSCSWAWGGRQTHSAHPPFFTETVGSVAFQGFWLTWRSLRSWELSSWSIIRKAPARNAAGAAALGRMVSINDMPAQKSRETYKMKT